jgi:mannose-6-phosphate isomerase
MFDLQGVVRNYDWGDHHAIARLLGHRPPGGPEAEYWLGAHPSAPGLIAGPSGEAALDVVIADARSDMIGPAVAEQFETLPYLLKILAADQPLSIQAHPSLEQARAGFARENRLGIELGAGNRSYRDDNHKPELICALTPFEAKCGFRPVSESLRLIERFRTPALEPLFDRLGGLSGGSGQATADSTRPDGADVDGARLADVVAWLLRLPSDQARVMADAAVETAAAAKAVPGSPLVAEFGPEVEWTIRIGDAFPGDVGVLVALLLNHVSLQPGQAIFLEAGNLHSYLQGVGIEIMANSDNVLRGGLTSKHIDIDQLLDVVDYQPSAAPIQTAHGPVHRFEVPIPEFGLTRIDSTNEPLDNQVFQVVGPEILLVTSGAITVAPVDGANQPITRTAGQSGFIPYTLGGYRLVDEQPGRTVAWRATVGSSFER